MNQEVFCGNNVELLKQYPDNYFDSVVTDPPYGLGKEPNVEDMLKAWLESGYMEVNGSGFMGKEWDAFVPQPIFWKEVFRVLKPGGHVLAFYGTRTYDWGVMAMRLGGFEVRDCIQWVYGSGFPKSHNISKAIDKMPKANDRLIEFAKILKSKRIEVGLSISDADNLICNGSTMYNFLEGRNVDGVLKIYPPNQTYYEKIKEHFGIMNWDDIVENNLFKIGSENGNYGFQKDGERWKEKRDLKVHTTEQAKQWDGWGSALKPANEPIVLARKPLEKGLSIAENVLKWGVGGINIDGCRVSGVKPDCKNIPRASWRKMEGRTDIPETTQQVYDSSQGRFPANLILTHHPECECKGLKKIKGQIDKPTNRTEKGNTWNENNSGLRNELPQNSGGFADENGEEIIEDWNCHEDCPIRIMDEQSGESKSTGGRIGNKNGAYSGIGENGFTTEYKKGDAGFGDKGGSSRFFYIAKASKSERNKGLQGFEAKTSGSLNFRNPSSSGRSENAPSVESMGGITKPEKNFHPTVKPIKLMQYLVRLITPPNGIVLDPFCGSGTTGVACKLEGFNFIGLELDAEYHKIAEARINNYVEEEEEQLTILESEEKPKVYQQTLF